MKKVGASHAFWTIDPSTNYSNTPPKFNSFRPWKVTETQ